MDLPDPWTHPLMTVPQAAKALGVSKQTAYRAVKDLDLPVVDCLGGWRRVPTRYVWEALGQPLPDPPGYPRVITLTDE